jgi:hypothetical protein
MARTSAATSTRRVVKADPFPLTAVFVDVSADRLAASSAGRMNTSQPIEFTASCGSLGESTVRLLISNHLAMTRDEFPGG